MSKKRIVIFIRKKRAEANSIEEIFYSIIKFLGSDIELLELPYSGANISSILKNIRFARRHRGDINHISGEVHYIALGTGRKTLLTIHDVQSIIKGGFIERIIKKWLWFKLPLLIVRKVSVISLFTKTELLKLCPLSKNKVHIINNPINKLQDLHTHISHRTPNAEMIILHVGTKSNKNLEGVLKAIKNLSVRLIVIGGSMTKGQKELADSLNINYKNYTNIPYSEVLKLYAQADIVTFPSFYEGFGMPILEANLVGVPILASDISVLHEVAGDAAYFVNPNSVDCIRQGILELMNNNSLRKKLIDCGKYNIERFSPQNIAEQYKSLYNQL